MKLKSKPTSDKIRLARKGGFKAKRPVKPNGKASYNALKNWGERYNVWVTKVDKAANDGSHMDKLKNDIRSI